MDTLNDLFKDICTIARMFDTAKTLNLVYNIDGRLLYVMNVSKIFFVRYRCLKGLLYVMKV